MFARDRLLPVALKLRAYLSHRNYINNLIKEHLTGLDFSDYPQHVRDFIVHVNKRINKLRSRKRHLVADLHRRVAYDIVKSHDIILLPSFNTSKMVKKAKNPGDKSRKIRKVTVNDMLSLAHYKFKLTLKWMARKYGKILIEVNEAYTSKTKVDGTIDLKLGGKKFIIDSRKKIDRDEHIARNTPIRFLTKCCTLDTAQVTQP